jgi:hypothetical protein
MPSKRQATLTLDGPEDQTVTFLADFDLLTLTRTQVGGYQSRPTGPTSTSFTPAAAEAFWEQVESLASKGLRDGPFDTLDAVVWKFTACDGKKTYEASGLINDGYSTGGDDEPYHTHGNRPDPVPVPPASHADIAALFALLSNSLNR